MKPKLLAFAWTIGPARSLVPVIQKLNGEGKSEAAAIGYGTSEEAFKKNSIQYKNLKDYGFDDFSIDSMDLILKRTDPQIILTGTSPGQEEGKNYNIEQAAIYCAKKNKIPSLTITDIWMDYSKFFDDSFTRERFKYLADKVGVLDEFMKHDMLQHGFNEKNLIVTGNPAFDTLLKLKGDFNEGDKKRARNDLGLGNDSYLFPYASQPLESYYGNNDSNPRFLGYTEKTVLKDVIGSMKKIAEKDKSLLVKVHPNENKEDLENIVKSSKADFPVVVNEGYDTNLSILSCDAVLSPFSTILMQAIYFDKPAISVQPNLKKEDIVLTNKFGVTVPCYSKNELDTIIYSLINDKEYNVELKKRRQNVIGVGNATDNVTNLIYNMLNIKNK